MCCGYAVGWEFVKSVMSSKQTFSGFTKVINSRYTIMSSSIPFMSKNTFIKWWFAWASAMEINFNYPCFGCGDNVKIVAGDGTKIGVTLKHANVTPIEEKQNNKPIQTPFKFKQLIQNLIFLMEGTDIISTESQIWSFKESFLKSSLLFFPELGDWVHATVSMAKGNVPLLMVLPEPWSLLWIPYHTKI